MSEAETPTPLLPARKCAACDLVADETGLCVLHRTMNPVRARATASSHRVLADTYGHDSARGRYHLQESGAWEDIARRLERG